MTHFGDITKLRGLLLPRVEVIIGGSPCQDLSVAGKRAGLAGERSGLFMEQIRVIKEMRKRDVEHGRTGADVFPRFMVWENVPGAFSSNGGEDFRAVLEETARVAEAGISIPRYEGGRWIKSGAIIGDGWSIAWRTHDAQYWGVPQRRKRIALVADFGGFAAPEILFERESVSGRSEPCEAARKGTAGAVGGGIASAVKGTTNESTVIYHEAQITSPVNKSNPQPGDPAPTLNTDPRTLLTYCIQGNCIDRADTAGCNGRGWCEDVSYTLNTIDRPAVMAYGIDQQGGKGGANFAEDVCPPILSDSHGTPHAVFCAGFSCGPSDKARSIGYQDEVSPTLLGGGGKPCVFDARGNGNGGTSLNLQNVCRVGSLVRRLTPLECERLQGFPDGWTDIGDWTDSKGKTHKPSDSARYKALGNSIALPFWDWMLKRLDSYCTEHTMASLFDGIGGFPLIWERINGAGSCLWASEIEEFCIAVTKHHFNKKE